MSSKNKIIVAIIAIVMLSIALGNHPYSYYQMLRWVITIISAYTAYGYFEGERTALGWIFVAIGILFNPIAPIYMQKDSWAVFDFITAIVFFTTMFLPNKKENK